MFRVRHLPLDTLREHVIVIHQATVEAGDLGFHPLDRVSVRGADAVTGISREVTGILNFCRDHLIAADEIGLSDDAFSDLGLAEGTAVKATISPPPPSVDLVRAKLAGVRFDRTAFDTILGDVTHHRYSKVELSMFVLACAVRSLDLQEVVDFTGAMIDAGTRLDFGGEPVADKHCIGGIPGNRTTMVVVPILAALGLTVPKTSSRAITSPAGTADTMGVLADVALTTDRLYRVVEQAGACIAWGGALDLAPADDILITVERPMGIDTEPQMVASILAKKKTAGATHVLIDIPVGHSTKVPTREHAEVLSALFRAVGERIDLHVEVIDTAAHGPIGRGIGPRLEALDVLSVLRRQKDAPSDLREKSLYLAARILEMTNKTPSGDGYQAARNALNSGKAEQAFNKIIAAQGARELPPEARHRCVIASPADGLIREIDCWQISRVAKSAGAPANVAAGVRLLRTVGDIVERAQPLFEIHAQSAAQLEFARSYAEAHLDMIRFGF